MTTTLIFLAGLALGILFAACCIYMILSSIDGDFPRVVK